MSAGVCVLHTCSTCRGPEKVSYPLGQELQTVMHCCLGAVNWTPWVLWKSSIALNLWPISPGPVLSFIFPVSSGWLTGWMNKGCSISSCMLIWEIKRAISILDSGSEAMISMSWTNSWDLWTKLLSFRRVGHFLYYRYASHLINDSYSVSIHSSLWFYWLKYIHF